MKESELSSASTKNDLHQEFSFETKIKKVKPKKKQVQKQAQKQVQKQIQPIFEENEKNHEETDLDLPSIRIGHRNEEMKSPLGSKQERARRSKSPKNRKNIELGFDKNTNDTTYKERLFQVNDNTFEVNAESLTNYDSERKPKGLEKEGKKRFKSKTPKLEITHQNQFVESDSIVQVSNIQSPENTISDRERQSPDFKFNNNSDNIYSNPNIIPNRKGRKVRIDEIPLEYPPQFEYPPSDDKLFSRYIDSLPVKKT